MSRASTDELPESACGALASLAERQPRSKLLEHPAKRALPDSCKEAWELRRLAQRRHLPPGRGWRHGGKIDAFTLESDFRFPCKEPINGVLVHSAKSAALSGH